MLGGAVTGKLVEARSTGVFALDPEAVKAFVKETNAASARFGCLVTTMLAKNPMVRPAAQGVEWALATGASVFEGGAAIVEEEEEEEDEEEEEAEQRRRAAEAEAARERRQRLAAEAEAKAAEERRQRLAAEAQAAEAERKLRAAEAAAEEKKRREAAAAAEAERRRRAEAKAAEEKRRREALVRTLEGHSESVRCSVRMLYYFVMTCLCRRSSALPCFRTGGASCLGRTTARSRCGTWRPANAWRR